MWSYHGVYITYLLHSSKFYHGVNVVSDIACIILDLFRLMMILFLDNSWNTKDCSTVNRRRELLENCMNQSNYTMNITEKMSESNHLYKFCSNQLTHLKVVSSSQEYFQ